MVLGVDRWRSHFAAFQDRYVLIGGVACDRYMEDAGLAFRATKDLDVVLIVELLDESFAEAFWAFIEAGAYERRAKADGGKLYRFEKPKAEDYPFMIELFSRAPDGFELPRGSILTPLPIDEAGASLSAILLDEGYYAFLRGHTRELNGLPLLSEAALISFKAKAYLDLSERKAAGGTVDKKDLRKHRNDVFRLLRLLPADSVQSLPDQIAADVAAFLRTIGADETFKPADFDVKMSADEALARLTRSFGL